MLGDKKVEHDKYGHVIKIGEMTPHQYFIGNDFTREEAEKSSNGKLGMSFFINSAGSMGGTFSDVIIPFEGTETIDGSKNEEKKHIDNDLNKPPQKEDKCSGISLYRCFSGHIQSDGNGGFWDGSNHIKSDGNGGFWDGSRHIRSDGNGGFWDGLNHIKSDGNGGFWYGSRHIRSDKNGGFWDDSNHIRSDRNGGYWMN